MKLALEGIKIIEYGNLICAPHCTKLLADMGAEVIKVEKPGEGDIARKRGPFLKDVPDRELSGMFLHVNTNKLGITLDIEKATGKEIFKKLIKDADILIEDTQRGMLENLGLGYNDLKSINSRLVMVSITPFGQTGPYKDYKGSDLIAWQMVGAGYTTPRWGGSADIEPLKTLNVASFMIATAAAVAALGALRAQRLQGIGQQVDVSQIESLFGLMAEHTPFWTYQGENPTRVAKPWHAPFHFIRCKDGWAFFYADEPHHWERLKEIMGNPEWAEIELFKDGFSRGEHWESLQPLLEDWALQHTKDEIYEAGKAKGVPLSKANSIAEVLENKQFRGRGFFVDIEHSKAGKLTYAGAPYIFSETPWTVRLPAPLLGQHNEEIYCQRLGYTREELVKMYEIGII